MPTIFEEIRENLKHARIAVREERREAMKDMLESMERLSKISTSNPADPNDLADAIGFFSGTELNLQGSLQTWRERATKTDLSLGVSIGQLTLAAGRSISTREGHQSDFSWNCKMVFIFNKNLDHIMNSIPLPTITPPNLTLLSPPDSITLTPNPTLSEPKPDKDKNKDKGQGQNESTNTPPLP